MANLKNANQVRLNNSDVKLMKLNGSVIYEKKTAQERTPYYIEYSVLGSSLATSYYLPNITLSDGSSGRDKYDDVEITLINKTTTTDTSVPTESVEKIKVWFPKDMTGLDFYSLNITNIYDMNINTSNITNMSNMFNYCNYLTSLDLSSWDTSSVTDMSNMFYYCSSLTSLGDISNWNVSSVTNMNNMFRNCHGLTSLDLSNWYTNSVTNFEDMFNECMGLVSLDIRNFNTDYAYNLYGFLYPTMPDLRTLRLDNWSYDSINKLLSAECLPTGQAYHPDGYYVTRKMYCKEENTYGLTLPDGWAFEYVN